MDTHPILVEYAVMKSYCVSLTICKPAKAEPRYTGLTCLSVCVFAPHIMCLTLPRFTWCMCVVGLCVRLGDLVLLDQIAQGYTLISEKKKGERKKDMADKQGPDSK